ncbi:MAG: two-component system, OmpR family, operon response regulator KdpE [Chloroflexota bacterium]|jgi:two-component system KDP operon response regulator KdpE|nr:two-component system, OmpR family, operon response regulator KdpE [Chloroflexota bacterium]
MRNTAIPFNPAHDDVRADNRSPSAMSATIPQPRVLLIEDELATLDFAGFTLRSHGYSLLEAGDGVEGLRRIRNDLPDLVLMDAVLPDLDGMDVLRQIRAWSTVPLIVLTDSEADEEKIRVLDLGADDCLVRPVSPGVLTARIKALLRRSSWAGEQCSRLVAVDERLQADLDEREVIVDGLRVPLRPTEFRLLSCLMQSAGRTLPFEAILARVWGPEYRNETQYVHLYVTYLRQKIEPDPAHPQYILTKRGVGYQFRQLAAAAA